VVVCVHLVTRVMIVPMIVHLVTMANNVDLCVIVATESCVTPSQGDAFAMLDIWDFSVRQVRFIMIIVILLLFD